MFEKKTAEKKQVNERSTKENSRGKWQKTDLDSLGRWSRVDYLSRQQNGKVLSPTDVGGRKTKNWGKQTVFERKERPSKGREGEKEKEEKAF